MIEKGIVSELRDGKIIINIKRHPACSACRLCAKNEAQLMRIEVENSVKARAGDRVELHLDDGIILKGALIAYVLPLAFLLTGLFGGNFLAGFIEFSEFRELFGAVCGIIFLVLSFFVIQRFNLINREKFKPTVIASPEGASSQ